MRILTISSMFILMFTGACSEETSFPSKNVTLIVPFAAGGGTDSVARILAKAMEPHLGQNVVVENRTGGSGAVGMTTGAKAKNDGYTISMITREIVTLPLLGLADINKDDFETIALVNFDPAVLLVNSQSQYKTYEDLITAAKANPGRITFASTAKPNFYLGALESVVGIKLKQIPFNGAGEAIPAVLGSHAAVTMVGPGEALSQVLGGQLRALAVLHDSRIEVYKDIPTLKELGINVTTGTWRGIGVPKGTPQEVKDTLTLAIEKAVNDPEFVSFMTERGFGVEYKNAEDFANFMTDDQNALSSVVEYIKVSEQ